MILDVSKYKNPLAHEFKITYWYQHGQVVATQKGYSDVEWKIECQFSYPSLLGLPSDWHTDSQGLEEAISANGKKFKVDLKRAWISRLKYSHASFADSVFNLLFEAAESNAPDRTAIVTMMETALDKLNNGAGGVC